ncbi:MAG TPA: SCP2 sterol-binding domain-containing protein [Egibacteraceae bacterium]|nr:SCP2 sterol-binding domain-containing protein [Egibacteraceae bacterium]
MPVFPSAEWMTDFCDRLSGHPEAAEVAHALDGVYRFVIEPAGPLDERHVYDVAITPDGDGAQVALVEDAGERRLTMTADYHRWQQLVRGELDVGMAVMLRRLKVSGDLSRLIGNVSSARPLVDALSGVETTWLEEA